MEYISKNFVIQFWSTALACLDDESWLKNQNCLTKFPQRYLLIKMTLWANTYWLEHPEKSVHAYKKTHQTLLVTDGFLIPI